MMNGIKIISNLLHLTSRPTFDASPLIRIHNVQSYINLIDYIKELHIMIMDR